MAPKSERQQVNVDFTKHPELLKDLDQMVDEAGPEMNRSVFLRELVRQEKARRAKRQRSLPLPTSSPSKSAQAHEVAVAA
jgi:metal-responsive CopG/Arc/MetJ family transcriptional regulator